MRPRLYPRYSVKALYRVAVGGVRAGRGPAAGGPGRVALPPEARVVAEHGGYRAECAGPAALGRRIPDRETLSREVAAWEAKRNGAEVVTEWQFTTPSHRVNAASTGRATGAAAPAFGEVLAPPVVRHRAAIRRDAPGAGGARCGTRATRPGWSANRRAVAAARPAGPSAAGKSRGTGPTRRPAGPQPGRGPGRVPVSLAGREPVAPHPAGRRPADRVRGDRPRRPVRPGVGEARLPAPVPVGAPGWRPVQAGVAPGRARPPGGPGAGGPRPALGLPGGAPGIAAGRPGSGSPSPPGPSRPRSRRPRAGRGRVRAAVPGAAGGRLGRLPGGLQRPSAIPPDVPDTPGSEVPREPAQVVGERRAARPHLRRGHPTPPARGGGPSTARLAQRQPAACERRR